MNGWEILAICTGVFYMLPWFSLHVWLACTRARVVGGWDNPLAIWLFVMAAVPFVNLYMAIMFFIMPLWYKIKYRGI